MSCSTSQRPVARETQKGASQVPTAPAGLHVGSSDVSRIHLRHRSSTPKERTLATVLPLLVPFLAGMPGQHCQLRKPGLAIGRERERGSAMSFFGCKTRR